MIINPKSFLKAKSGASWGNQGTSQMGMKGLLWSLSLPHHKPRNTCLSASRSAVSLVQDKRNFSHTFMDSETPRVLQWLWFLWHTPVGMTPNSIPDIVRQNRFQWRAPIAGGVALLSAEMEQGKGPGIAEGLSGILHRMACVIEKWSEEEQPKPNCLILAPS